MNKIMDYRKVRSSLDFVSFVMFKVLVMRIKRTVVVLIFDVCFGFLFFTDVLSISIIILFCWLCFVFQLVVGLGFFVVHLVNSLHVGMFH
jgi:hypothetical protein